MHNLLLLFQKSQLVLAQRQKKKKENNTRTKIWLFPNVWSERCLQFWLISPANCAETLSNAANTISAAGTLICFSRNGKKDKNKHTCISEARCDGEAASKRRHRRDYTSDLWATITIKRSFCLLIKLRQTRLPPAKIFGADELQTLENRRGAARCAEESVREEDGGAAFLPWTESCQRCDAPALLSSHSSATSSSDESLIQPR